MTALPPLEKLPLAARKSLRDTWEAKKEGLESDLSEVCNTAWKIDFNPNTIYPYAPEGSYFQRNPGSALEDYAGGAITELKRFKYNNGDAGIADLNAICHTKTLVLEADLSSSTGNGVAIKDGFLCLLFSPENIDTNIGDCLGGDKLEDALSAAPLPEGVVLPLKARSTIGSVYDKKSKSLLSTLSETLKNPDISFNPNFEENYTKLKAAEESGTKLSSNKWQVNLGSYTLGYLDNIVDNLRRDNFHQDDMFQEAFAEAVTKSEIVLRVVDSLKGSESSEVVVEDGILYIQCTPYSWGRNIAEAGQGVVDLL